MGDKSAIEWTEATKWCTARKTTHDRSAFGRDPSRGDGLAARCLASRRVLVRKERKGKKGPQGWRAATRDGDKLQARRRVNYLVEQKRIPHPDDLPCSDCADEVFVGNYRHEYDHARGYDGENQLYVEAVCSRCHHNREEGRRGANQN